MFYKDKNFLLKASAVTAVVCLLVAVFFFGPLRRADGGQSYSSDVLSDNGSVYSFIYVGDGEEPPALSSLNSDGVGSVSVEPVSPSSNSQKPSSQSSQSQPSSQQPSEADNTVNYSEMKAVWMSFLDIEGILKGKTESQYRTNIKNAFLNCKGLGINTVIFQVRPYGDAIYKSALFPWSEFASGQLGESLSFDPLKIAVDTAHSMDLSIHAWINPYRLFMESDISKVSDSYKVRQWYNTKKGNYVISYNSRLYLNPGIPEVRDFIISGVEEVIKNYDVDGIQFDDYFYPQDAPQSFDTAAYAQYGSGKTLANFRKASVNTLIKNTYSKIKNHNKYLKFGISPQANIQNNTERLYFDVETVCSSSGYVDYICPQIYYSYDSETKNYLESIEEWNKLVKSPVKLCVGVAPYKVGTEEPAACMKNSSIATCKSPSACGKYGWIKSSNDIMKRQYLDAKSKAKNYCGVMFFRYDFLIALPSSEKQNLKSAMSR